MEAKKIEEQKELIEKIRIIHENKAAHLLEQSWGNINPMFAVCSGGLYPGKIPAQH